MWVKSLFVSKTFWFNVLTGLSLFFALPELTAVLPAGGVQWLLLAQAAINILLRLVTSDAVEIRNKPRPGYNGYYEGV